MFISYALSPLASSITVQGLHFLLNDDAEYGEIIPSFNNQLSYHV